MAPLWKPRKGWRGVNWQCTLEDRGAKELLKPPDFRWKTRSASCETAWACTRPRRRVLGSFRSLSLPALTPGSPQWPSEYDWPLPGHPRWTETVLISQIFQHTTNIEGAPAPNHCCARRSARLPVSGPYSRSTHSHSTPRRAPCLTRVGEQPCTAAVFSGSLHHLESPLKIRFLGLALQLLQQHHGRKGLERSHSKQCPSDSTH